MLLHVEAAVSLDIMQRRNTKTTHNLGLGENSIERKGMFHPHPMWSDAHVP